MINLAGNEDDAPYPDPAECEIIGNMSEHPERFTNEVINE